MMYDSLSRRLVLSCLLVAAVLCPSTRAQVTAKPFQATVRSMTGADLLILSDARSVRLEGISLPSSVVRPKGFVAAIRAFVRERVLGREVWVVPSGRKSSGESADWVGLVSLMPDGPSINEQVLERGLAIFSIRSPEPVGFISLQRAAKKAQLERKGWFAQKDSPRAGAVPYLNGAVVGLHYKIPSLDYHRQIDELVAAGFQHLSFLFSVFLADVEAVRINRNHKRTVTDARLLETIRYAKQKGVTVLLLPIVLLEKTEGDDWRGTIRPKDHQAFWENYDEFLSHYTDIAQVGGADMISVGSELGSMEDQTEAWRRIIANVRGRYTGLLTYSANWDHIHVPRFFDRLDAVGLTAYFELTKKTDASVDELAASWLKVVADLKKTVADIEQPLFFSELGYCSQDGAAKYPWNYYLAKDKIDVQEQADCFEAFLRTVPSMAFMHGAYFFDYFDDGGEADHSYSPRGKPAMAQWRRWARWQLAGASKLPGLPRKK